MCKYTKKLLLLPLALLLLQCNGTKPAQSEGSQDQLESANPQQKQMPVVISEQAQEQQAPIEQGIAGKVLWQAGNLMPSPDAPISQPSHVQRTLYVYELTKGNQVKTTDGVFHTDIQTNLVTQVVTDANGNFAVTLKPGKYSLFSKEEKGLFANLFDGEMNINPVEVKQGQVTNVEFLINYQASY
ncbi:carboxypeptidase-like regulatory domain-containing protein [uncultured Pontibacter sp.]|uniref:carboxypeptidase-like regulatory domain-containing protein n=1 Tax=uncultured Pontibacter sp. TaxID=453356 RepID=UPI002601C6AE|nr:carboxypeptidase-like regulatory domain-containing protein [uncultured Pontibacter sp.]